MDNNIVKVGVGVFVMKEGKVLLGKRKLSHGEGEYETPGGHLEYMESFEDCAKREVREEVGIEITNIRLLYTANLRVWKPKHYIHIEVVADWLSGEPQVMEPDKKEKWEWYKLNEIPKPLFKTEELALQSIKSGEPYYDLE